MAKKINNKTTDLKIGSVLKVINIKENTPYVLNKFYNITDGDGVGALFVGGSNIEFTMHELGVYFEHVATLEDIEDLEHKALILKETFEQLKKTSSDFIQDEILKSYKKRVNLLTKKYWSHSKQTRKDYNLREELCDMTFYFSGAAILRIVEEAIFLAEKNEYPIDVYTHYEKKVGNDVVENFQQLRNWLDLNLNLLDYEILRAEYEMLKNGDFKPYIERLNPEIEENQIFNERILSMMKLKKSDLL